MEIDEWHEFAARKTAEANAGAIAPLVTDCEHADPALQTIGNEWSRRLFDGAFYLSPPPGNDVPATNLVFVRSREGNTVATDPSVFGGGDADKHLIYEGLSRVAADAVLGGAGTIGHGNVVLSIWRRELVELRASLGLPRHPTQIVATVHGVPLDGLLFNVPDVPVIVLTVPRGLDAMHEAIADRPWITPLVMRTPHDLPGAFRALRAAGIARLSCIGGRTLAAELIDAGLVRDLYLTTTARSAGQPNTPFYSGALSTREIVRKHGTGPDTGIVFQHQQI